MKKRINITSRALASTVVGLAIVLLAGPGWGQARKKRPGPVAVSFQQALRLASKAPGEAAARQRELVLRRDADDEISLLDQNPVLQLQPGARLAPGEDRGLEGQVSLSQSFNLAQPGPTRAKAAARERDVLAEQVEAALLERRIETARRWLDLWQLAQAAKLLRAEQKLAKELSETMSLAVSAGVRTQPDLLEAESYQSGVARRKLDLEGAIFETRTELATLMGISPRRPVRPVGGLPDSGLPSPKELKTLHARLDRLPSVQVHRLSEVAAKARAEEAEAMAGTRLGVGVIAARESPNAFMLFGTVTLTPAIFERGQRNRAKEEGEAVRQQSLQQEARLKAERAFTEAVHEVEHQAKVNAHLTTKVIPRLERLVAFRRKQLEAGTSTVFPLLRARRDLLDAQKRQLDTQRRLAWARVTLRIFVTELAAR